MGSHSDEDARSGVRAAREFCRAFTARDWDRMTACLDAHLVFGVSGASPLAGLYESPETLVGLVKTMVDRSDGTLRFSSGPENYDILSSDVHVALLVPFSAEHAGRSLESSYQIWQFHGGEQIGGYGGLYVWDQAGFDSFWS